MSWWDRYFAPGDLRARNQLLATPTTTQEPQIEEKRPLPNIPARIDAAHRARRQNALLFGGLGFTFLSLFITRRALAKKNVQAAKHALEMAKVPKDSTTGETVANNMRSEGSLDGAEALFLATLNVCSIFMLGVGGFMKYFDIADVEDMREHARRNMGWDVYGGDEKADKELEEWMGTFLRDKDGAVVDMGRERLVGLVRELAVLEEEREKNGGRLSEGRMRELIEKRREVIAMEEGEGKK